MVIPPGSLYRRAHAACREKCYQVPCSLRTTAVVFERAQSPRDFLVDKPEGHSREAHGSRASCDPLGPRAAPMSMVSCDGVGDGVLALRVEGNYFFSRIRVCSSPGHETSCNDLFEASRQPTSGGPCIASAAWSRPSNLRGEIVPQTGHACLVLRGWSIYSEERHVAVKVSG